MHIRICFSKICVNNIEYVKLKTHGKITRMDSIALLKWYVFFVLSSVALFTLAASSLQPARGNRMFTALVRSQYDFILKCVKELFFAWVFSSIQFTKRVWGLDPTVQHTTHNSHSHKTKTTEKNRPHDAFNRRIEELR